MEQFRIMYKLITLDDNIETQEVILEALEMIKTIYGSSSFATVEDIEKEVNELFANNDLNLQAEIDVLDTDIIVTIKDKDTYEDYAKVSLKDTGYTVIIEVDSDEEIARRLMEVQLNQYQQKDQRKRYLYLYFVKEVKRLLEAGLEIGEIEARLNNNEILKLARHVITITQEESIIYIKFIDYENYTSDIPFEYNNPEVDFDERYTPADHKIRKILKEAGISDSVLSLEQLVNIISEQGYSNDYITNLLLEDKDLRLRISGYYNFLKNIDIIDGYALDVLPLLSDQQYPYTAKIIDAARDVKVEIGQDDIVKLEPGQLKIISGTDTTILPLDHLKYGYTEFDEHEQKYIINIKRILIIEPHIMEIDPKVFLPEEIEDKRRNIDNGLIQSYHYSWIVVLKGTYTQGQSSFTYVIPYTMANDYDSMYMVWQGIRMKTQTELDTIIRKKYKSLPKDAIIESCVVRLEQIDITEYPFSNKTQYGIQWSKRVFLGAVKTFSKYIEPMINFLTVCRWEPLQSFYIQEPYIYLDTVRELLPNWSEEQIQTVISNIKTNISNQQTIDFYEEMRIALTDRGWEKIEIDKIFATKTYLQENPIKQSEQLYIEDDYNLSKSDALIIMNEVDDNLSITLQTYLNLIKAHALGIPIIMWSSYTNSIYKDYIDSTNPYLANKNLYNVFKKINNL